jgi:regulator of replication initiation timing
MTRPLVIRGVSDMDILGGIGGAIDLVLRAKKLADQLKNLEMKEIIVDLQRQLIDLKEQIVTLREENIQLKAEARKLALPPELVLKDGMYHFDGRGPCCTGCWDSNQKQILLKEGSEDLRTVMGYRYECPVCNACYK